MRDHIKILGILNIVMGSFAALAGVGVLLVMGTVGGIIAASIHSSSGGDLGDSTLAGPIIALVGTCIAIFFLVLAAPSIIGGWGLLRFRPWSRVLMIVISALHLFHIPLGTALGVYGLWVLVNDETRRLLESGGGLPPVAFPYPPAGPQAS